MTFGRSFQIISVLLFLFFFQKVVIGKVGEQLGVNIHFLGPRTNEMKMLSEGGWKWVRMDFIWSMIETKKGVYDFSSYDVLVKNLDKYKIKALFIFDYGNPLYDGGNAPSSDEGRQAFANFTHAGVSRYSGKGYYWELWNEPDASYSWKPTPDASAYAQLALTVGKVLKASFPGEIFFGAALSSINLEYSTTLFKAGVLNYFDAFSVHGYSNSPEEWIPRHAALRKLIDSYKPTNKEIPIICSEWGQTDIAPGFNMDEQAKWLVRQYLVTIGTQSPVTIWYDWHDDGNNATYTEDHFGTVKYPYIATRYPPYDPKPAYFAMQFFANVFSDTHLNKTIFNNNGHYVYQFTSESSHKSSLIAWTDSKRNSTIMVPLDEDACFNQAQYDGKVLPKVCTSQKQIQIKVFDGPTYLIAE